MAQRTTGASASGLFTAIYPTPDRSKHDRVGTTVPRAVGSPVEPTTATVYGANQQGTERQTPVCMGDEGRIDSYSIMVGFVENEGDRPAWERSSRATGEATRSSASTTGGIIYLQGESITCSPTLISGKCGGSS